MFGCKYQDQKEPPKPEPPRGTKYRIKERSYSLNYLKYAVVRDELAWQEREYASTDDKAAAEKIAALLNGQAR